MRIHSRRFIDIADIRALISERKTTYYEVGKLAFNLLPIVLSKIEALGGDVHEVTVFLRGYPPFHLIKNDPLELEKVKAAQAIDEFLKV